MIPGWSVSPWLFATLGFVGALVLAAAWRVHALSRQWLDQPGERRLHVVPIPRGGGVAIAAVMLAAMPGLGEGGALVALGLLLTTGVGLIDDVRPLPALPKLGLQAVGALPLAVAWPLAPEALGVLGGIAAAWAAVLALVNFWNFIDGSNGMAASQALLVGMATMFIVGASTPAGWLGLAIAAGCLGFLPFNVPVARLFLGDAGSFALGYGVAALLLMVQAVGDGPAWYLLLLPSAVMADAGLTLLGRLLRHEKVWLAHRGHLYQRAVLHGWSHLRIGLVYAAWTLAAALAAGVMATVSASTMVQCSVLALAALLAMLVYAWGGRHWPPSDLSLDRECAR